MEMETAGSRLGADETICEEPEQPPLYFVLFFLRVIATTFYRREIKDEESRAYDEYHIILPSPIHPYMNFSIQTARTQTNLPPD